MTPQKARRTRRSFLNADERLTAADLANLGLTRIDRAAATADELTLSTPKAGLMNCPACGTPNSSDASHCHRCHRKF